METVLEAFLNKDNATRKGAEQYYFSILDNPNGQLTVSGVCLVHNSRYNDSMNGCLPKPIMQTHNSCSHSFTNSRSIADMPGAFACSIRFVTKGEGTVYGFGPVSSFC